MSILARLKSLRQNETFMRYFKNSSWMMAEYAVRMISAIFVSIYVARYLGPENFGVLSYALAIVAVFMAIGRLGMDSILVRDVSKHPEQLKAYMGTAFGLMVIAAILGVVILTVLIHFFESDQQTKVYIWIIALSLLFQTSLAIDYGFQAQVKAKYSSVAKVVALGVSSLIKIYLVWVHAELLLFAVAYAVDHAIIALMLIVTHRIKRQPSFFFEFRVNLVKPLLVSAWPMVLSAVCFMLYARIDQIMIKYYLGMEQLGLYAAAAKVFEGWTMIPFILIISLLPLIVKAKEKSEDDYEGKVVHLYRSFLFLSISVAIFTTIFSKDIVLITFGSSFEGMSSVLTVFMWASVFTTMGTVTVRLLVVEKIERKIIKITSLGLVVNFTLNILLIPSYGILGAAVATLFSLFVAYYLHDYIDKEMSFILAAKNKSLNFLGKVRYE